MPKGHSAGLCLSKCPRNPLPEARNIDDIDDTLHVGCLLRRGMMHSYSVPWWWPYLYPLPVAAGRATGVAHCFCSVWRFHCVSL